jgi:hypothetical protein
LGNIPVHANTAQINLQANDAPYFKPGQLAVTITNSAVQSGPYAVHPQLVSYPLVGTVTNSVTAALLQGIPVSSGQASTVTLSSGTYSLAAPIVGRSATAAGTMPTTAGPGIATNDGVSYTASSASPDPAVPTTFDVTTPIVVNFALSPSLTAQGAGL